MRILRKVRLRSPVWEITTAKISVVRIASLPIVQIPTLNSWFAHFWTQFSHLWCSPSEDSSILKRDKNNCFTEKHPYSLKALKAFYVKTVVPLSISLCQKSVRNERTVSTCFRFIDFPFSLFQVYLRHISQCRPLTRRTCVAIS